MIRKERLQQAHWPTSSFRHLSSTSSLDRHDTQIFLFLVFLYFEPRHSSNHLFSSRLHWRNCSLLTSPCFHSRWRGQEHEDSNGILGGSRGHHRRYLHLFTTYFHNYIQNIQIYSTVIAKTQIGAQGDNPEQRFSRWLTRGVIRGARTKSP